MSARSLLIPISALALAATAGCATEGPPPQAELTRAQTLVDQADKGPAQHYAAADLQRAHEELSAASSAESALVIEGHTDSTGSQATHEALSQRRADAVANALIDRGVSAQNLRAVGRGPDLPVASNATPAGRQQNRRVEVICSDHDGRFARGDLDSAAMR
jgi:flagellar motor protein MotB